ncbi:hypothetical protein [Paenibacillus sp. NRS-1760]|uniref:hypothetical protein n=1 Tax=Paenibacillus sp. NRS-1760 TaxID=3233902 RepID=UPI003D2C00CA
MENTTIEITGREQYLIELALKRFFDQLELEINRKPKYQDIARRNEVAALYHKILHSSMQCI